MPYESIPGVGATYLDGAFATVISSDQPRILILGTAESGLSNSLYQVTSIAAAEQEFGSDAELMKPLHEAVGQGADNVFVMRIGGQQGICTITDGAGAQLVIRTEYRDNTILERYKLILRVEDPDGSVGDLGTLSADEYLRVIIWDDEDEAYVYDSDETLVLDTGIVAVSLDSDFELLEIGLDAYGDADPLSPVASGNLDPDVAIALGDLAGGGTDFDLTLNSDSGGSGVPAVVQTQTGDDGIAMSLVERYAALATAYQILDYRYADMVVPCGVHLDDPNITDMDDGSHPDAGSGTAVYSPDYSTGVPAMGDPADDVLGLLWQYRYRGRVHTFFMDTPNMFDDTATSGPHGDDGASGDSLTFTAVEDGPIGELITVTFTDTAVAGSETIGVVVTGSGASATVAITVGYEAGASGPNQIAAAWDADPDATDYCTIADVGTTAYTSTDLEAGVTLALSAGGSVLTSEDLTADSMPTAVLNRFYEGSQAEVREANFAHQLASFCYIASTTWSTMLGIIPVREPDAYDRLTLAAWAGDKPTYSSTFGPGELGVDAPSDNGEGLLGNKFLAGAAGYRPGSLTDGGATDGLAGGGFIQTVGASLPNGEGYGISMNDEAEDANDKVIDIGKHLFVTYDYPIHRNAFNGGSTYRGNLCGVVAGKFAITDEKEEPIGVNGSLRRISQAPKLLIPQVNDLASIRMIGTRREEGVGYIIVSARTCAHPDSDWTRLSTIRSVNREIEGIRTIAKQYIGKEFSSTRLLSLQSAIQGFLKAEKSLGYNQGAVASLSYSRADKIMGRLTIKLKMIPPFSIESITVETSLAAEEEELTT